LKKDFQPPVYPLCSLSQRGRIRGRQPALPQGVEIVG
jgi:hypothetical protein